MILAFTVIVMFLIAFLAAAIATLVGWIILQKRSGNDESEPADGGPRLLKEENLSTFSLWGGLLARFDFVKGLQLRLEEADLPWTVGRLTSMMLLSGTLGLALLSNVTGLPFSAALVAALVCAGIPCAYVARKRSTRLVRFEEQFPEALEFLARSLRAGHPFVSSLEQLAAESSPPVSIEMRKLFDERQLGLAWDMALHNLSRRVPLIDIGFFSAAVQLQSRTGGNLGEVLGRLAETMRERFSVRGEVRALASHGKLSGTVLTLVPIVVTFVLLAVNPSYLRPLLTSPMGRNMVAAAVACLVLAHFVIRKIVHVKL